MPFLFEISGIRLNVEVNDDAFTAAGIPAFFPSAMVDCPKKHGAVDVDGTCFVTAAFMKMPKYTRELILTHEAGHVAMGHLTLDLTATDDCVTCEKLEAEADRWAANQRGEAAFDVALDAVGHETLKILTGLKGTIKFEQARSMLEAEVEQRKINYKSI